MRQELNPDAIVRTSDFTGFEGLRVVIQEFPKNGGFGSGRKGVPYLSSAIGPVKSVVALSFGFKKILNWKQE